MAAFEESLTRLEAVVAKLEGGELTLEQSVALYEQGVRLSDECKKELDAAEGRIQVLVRGKDGAFKLQDMKGSPERDETQPGLEE